jgi:hypothetical protein
MTDTPLTPSPWFQVQKKELEFTMKKDKDLKSKLFTPVLRSTSKSKRNVSQTNKWRKTSPIGTMQGFTPITNTIKSIPAKVVAKPKIGLGLKLVQRPQILEKKATKVAESTKNHGSKKISSFLEQIGENQSQADMSNQIFINELNEQTQQIQFRKGS